MSDELALQMRLGMRRLASGVSVITARDEEENRFAMTASSVTSLSDAPPSLLVCIHNETRIGGAIAKSGMLGVNILSQKQREISVTCAIPEVEASRFDCGKWQVDPLTGLSFLEDAQAAFFCEIAKIVPYGTHNIFVGNIKKVILHGDVDPLVYYDGAYR